MRTPDFFKLAIAVMIGGLAVAAGVWFLTKREKAGGLIRVETPRAGEAIASPLVVQGQARGTWFFEAVFPVVLTDWDGRIIAQTPAQAQGDWMTDDFVPFRATLEFQKPEIIGDFAKRGALILKKDNPSGLPEHDEALEIPVFFK